MRTLVMVYYPAIIILMISPIIVLTFRSLRASWRQIAFLVLFMFGITEAFWTIMWKLTVSPG